VCEAKTPDPPLHGAASLQANAVARACGTLHETPATPPASGASGEFGSHAIPPRSGHQMQVMTLIIETTVKLPPSSRRTPGSSGFRRAPARFGNEKHGDSWRRSTIKKPA
jgi:hypothetical protein